MKCLTGKLGLSGRRDAYSRLFGGEILKGNLKEKLAASRRRFEKYVKKSECRGRRAVVWIVVDGKFVRKSKQDGKAKIDARNGNNVVNRSCSGLSGGGDKGDLLNMKIQENEVAGFAPREQQITGRDNSRAQKVSKRNLGNHMKGKKHDEARKMSGAGVGEKM